MDLNAPPPWSKGAANRLGAALRDGEHTTAAGIPLYDDMMLWHADLAQEVHERIEATTWTVAQEINSASGRLSDGLLVSSRPKTQDTIVQKLRRQPTLQLSSIQDIAGVRIDSDLYLGEQMELARAIAEHFGHDESSIHDLRDGAHAGYRAVHVWLRLPAGRVEVQIRTVMQTIWANLYEKLADHYGREIRYGEQVDGSAAEVAEAQHMIKRMQEFAVQMTESETELQRLAEMDERERGVQWGALHMGRAMFLAAVYLILKGDIDPVQFSNAFGGGAST